MAVILMILPALWLAALFSGASPSPLPAQGCDVPTGSAVVFWLGEREVAPGQHVPLQALFTSAPGQFEPVPSICIKSPIVAPKRIVRLSADGTGMDVAADAGDGGLINVAAVVGGISVMSHARVVVPSAHPIIGLWHERPGPCQALPGGGEATPIGEFSITATGFSVAWQPFEAYHDYGGAYDFDPLTGALTLIPTGGAYLPPGTRLRGTARLTSQGWLEVSDINFGASRGGFAHPANCVLVFEKSGPVQARPRP